MQSSVREHILQPNGILPIVFRAWKSTNWVLFGEKPRTFGIKKASVHLWIEMLYFIITLGKVTNYLTTQAQVHSNPTKNMWLMI